MDGLYITDVALRDGLQNQTTRVSTEAKLTLAELLFTAGVASIEATSFVSPKHVPQMADAEAVIAGLQGRARVSALVPNVRGLKRAMVAGVSEIAVVLAATETMNRKNINMSLQKARDVCKEVILTARAAGLKTRAYIAVAFECPFEGATSSEVVSALCREMWQAGADEIVVADTIGAAGPVQVRKLLTHVLEAVPGGQVAVHFHDTRGMGLANSYAAIEAGIRRFDASVGGIGGCPFAPGAAGNLATEDLVLLAQQSGLRTGISLAKLLDVIDFAEQQLSTNLGGRAARWLRQQKENGRLAHMGVD